jgi:colanic acid biosynthesis glycosyl transferase WcaI
VPRFFIVSLNYSPELTGFAPHTTALAEHLARRGHEVTVFTGFPFLPQWSRRDEDRGRLFSILRTGRLTVRRLTHSIPRRPSSAWQRVAMEGSLAVMGFWAMVAAMMESKGRPDAILYVGAQPALAMLARVVAGLTRRPYFVNINDLAAQAARDVGIVGGPLYRLLDAFEFAAYGGAAGASVLTGSFARALVAHGYPASRIRVIRSPINVDQIRPVPRDPAFRTQHGIPDDAWVVMFVGSMGRKQGMMNVVAAAALLRATSVRWVLVGAGEAKPELIDATRRLGLEKVIHFVPLQEHDALPRAFAAADVLLLNQLGTVADTVIPTKLLTYMAAGRPVLAAVNPSSQAAELLRDADGGLLVAPDSPEALAAGVRSLMTMDHQTLAAFGARNRAYAEVHFDQQKVLAAHEDFMLSTIGASEASPPAAASPRR